MILRLVSLDSRGCKALGLSLYVYGLCAAFGMAFPQLAQKPVAIVAGVMAQLLAALIASWMERLRGWILAQPAAFVLTLIATFVLPEPYADSVDFGVLTGAATSWTVFCLFVALVVAEGIYTGIRAAFDWLDERIGMS